MKLRSLKDNLVLRFKNHTFLNNLLRNNPYYYNKTCYWINQFQKPHLEVDELHKQQETLVNNILRFANKTEYGRKPYVYSCEVANIGKGRNTEKPAEVLSKSLMKVPASTSGTSGVPLRLFRSIGSIASEQAFLDFLINSSGHSFRNAKIAVLRGDNIKNPKDKVPPFGEYRDSKYLVLSLIHLNEHSLDWYTEELERFKPDIFLGISIGSKFFASLLLKKELDPKNTANFKFI